MIPSDWVTKQVTAQILAINLYRLVASTIADSIMVPIKPQANATNPPSARIPGVYPNGSKTELTNTDCAYINPILKK